MSFGFSPSDVKLLVEITSRIYVAFNGKSDSSTAQVEALIQEFTTLARCLLQLEGLLKEYGKPLPFPIDDFWNTLEICEKRLEPYRENLIDKNTGIKKVYWTVRYIGFEGEMAGLKERVSGHIQALNMCMQFLSLRLQFEQSHQRQRLLLPPPFRAMSLGGQPYANHARSDVTQPDLQALPAFEEDRSPFKDWDLYNHWLRAEEERISREVAVLRPLSHELASAAQPTLGNDAVKVLGQLQQKANDAIVLKENRTKRAFLSPNEAMRPEVSESMKQSIKNLPPAPHRTYTLDSVYSGNFSRFGNHLDAPQSMSTLDPINKLSSPPVSPKGSPQIPATEFTSIDWSAVSPTSPVTPLDFAPEVSVSTARSSLSTSPGSRPSSFATGFATASTTPEGYHCQNPRSPSVQSMGTDGLGHAAFQWTKICRKVQVERSMIRSDGGVDRNIVEIKECDVQWCNQEDGAISIRALYRSSKDNKPKVWTLQTFPASGPSIPLTTTIAGKTIVDFPRRSFGRLEKRCTDIKYLFPSGHPGAESLDAATNFQTLLYSNGGKDDILLLYDRPIVSISSDKHHPECRGKNIRLWAQNDRKPTDQGFQFTKYLRVLFYASSLESKGHWVEESQHAFRALGANVLTKPSQKVKLCFATDGKRWSPEQLFHRRSSSHTAKDNHNVDTGGTKRRDSSTNLHVPWTSSTVPGASLHLATAPPSNFQDEPGFTSPFGTNRFGYLWLEVKFCNERDQSDFVKIWTDFGG